MALHSGFTRTLLSATILMFITFSPLYAEPIKIYLLGGQSNAAGAGTIDWVPPELVAPFPQVQIYAGGEVADANLKDKWLDLQPGFGYRLGDHGPELAFGHAMADNLPSETVAIIKYSWGASNLAEQWAPPDANGQGAGEHYVAFMDTVGTALAILDANGQSYELAGMLWMQGEADAEIRAFALQYEQNLTGFIESIRDAFNEPNLPFIIGQIHQNMWLRQDLVRQAQYDVAAVVYNAEMFVTRDIKCYIHYAEDGFIDLGYRFADQALWMLNRHQLIGQANGQVVDANGVLLTCSVKAEATHYQLLIGPDANHINYLVSDTL